LRLDKIYFGFLSAFICVNLRFQFCASFRGQIFLNQFNRKRGFYFLVLALLSATDLLLAAVPDEDAAVFAAPPALLAPPPVLFAAPPPVELFDLPALPVPFVPASLPGRAPAVLLAFVDFPALPVPFVPASPALAFDEAPFLPPLESPPLDFDDFTPALPVPFVPASPPFLFAPPVVDELPLLVFAEAVFPAPAEPPCPLVFAEAAAVFDALPALPVPFVPASPPSSSSLTASATTPKTPTAAPVAAPARSSPAASLAWSRSPGSDLFLEDFLAPPLPLCDFAGLDFAPVDF
jgi:hypothetical protein